MKTTQVNLRLEPELVRDLEAAARLEALDRGTMMRKLLLEGLAGWKLQHALRRYQLGEISIGRASEESGRSHWELLELAQAQGVAYRIDIEDSIARARSVMTARRDRVAEAGAAYTGAPARGGRTGATRRDATARAARMGQPDERTLPDLPPKPGGVLLVGLNPSPSSAARGHYYQGKLGRRLWQRLTTIGLLTGASPGLEDDAFVALGHGLTDLVKRVTPGLSGLTDNELREGASALEARVRQWRPGVVVFVFKEVAVRALGRADLQPGPCGEFAGATAFLLPGPYAKKSAADRVYASLRELQRG